MLTRDFLGRWFDLLSRNVMLYMECLSDHSEHRAESLPAAQTQQSAQDGPKPLARANQRAWQMSVRCLAVSYVLPRSPGGKTSFRWG